MKGKTIWQLNGIVFMTDRLQHELNSLYGRITSRLYKYADDTKENVIEAICNELQCKTMTMKRYKELNDNLKVA